MEAGRECGHGSRTLGGVELAADVGKLQLVVRCWSLRGLFIPHKADGRETIQASHVL